MLLIAEGATPADWTAVVLTAVGMTASAGFAIWSHFSAKKAEDEAGKAQNRANAIQQTANDHRQETARELSTIRQALEASRAQILDITDVRTIPSKSGPTRVFFITITNRSSFAVGIDRLGVSDSSGKVWATPSDPITKDDLPHKIGARENYSFIIIAPENAQTDPACELFAITQTDDRVSIVVQSKIPDKDTPLI